MPSGSAGRKVDVRLGSAIPHPTYNLVTSVLLVLKIIFMKTFSTQAFRSFKIFIGELTAAAAGIYVGIQEAMPIIESLGTNDPWRVAASKHNVVLHGVNSKDIVDSSSRLNIVSLYSGFDLFITDTRSQFFVLHRKEWRQSDGDTPFDALERNTPSTLNLHREKLGRHRIAVLNYYRLLRNAIAHPTPENKSAIDQFMRGNSSPLEVARQEYGMQTAPNELALLNFHDVKFLARVALDLAEAIDQDFDPGDDALTKLLPLAILGRTTSPERNRNALIGWLCSTYGVPKGRAECIITKL